MAGWSDLSIDLKQKIVGELDVFSRNRLSLSSKSNQSLVAATPLFLPRVNIYESPQSATVTLTIFTGINQYLQLEIKKFGAEKIQILRIRKRDKNTNQKSKIVKWAESPIQITARIFKKLAMSPETVLGGLEIGIQKHENKEFDLVFGKSKIRAQTLTIVDENSALPILARCQAADIQEIQMKHNGNLKVIEPWDQESEWLDYKDKNSASETMLTTENTIRHDYLKKKVKPSRRLYMGNDGFVVIEENSTDCGDWVETMSAYTSFVPFTRDPSKCYMRWACPTHADPFVHWYYTTRVVSKMTEEMCPVPARGGQTLKNYSKIWKDRYGPVEVFADLPKYSNPKNADIIACGDSIQEKYSNPETTEIQEKYSNPGKSEDSGKWTSFLWWPKIFAALVLIFAIVYSFFFYI